MLIVQASYRVAAVLFDLDGTLHKDSIAVPLLVEAASAHGYEFEGATVRQGELFIPRLCTELGIPEPEARAIYADYVALYHGRAGAARPTAHASSLLESLYVDGVRLALVTNKVESLATRIIAGFGWERFFPAVLGQDSTPFTKPDARRAPKHSGPPARRACARALVMSTRCSEGPVPERPVVVADKTGPPGPLTAGRARARFPRGR
jgi:phosphoglycolate phosphatase-like HAD superfamily hydrolase